MHAYFHTQKVRRQLLCLIASYAPALGRLYFVILVNLIQFVCVTASFVTEC